MKPKLHIYVATFIVLFVALPIFPGNPPPLPRARPPLPVIPPGATSPHFPELPPRDTPLDLQTVKTESLSSSVYYSTLLSLGLLHRASTTSGNALITNGSAPTSANGPRLHASSDSLTVRVLAAGIVGASWNFNKSTERTTPASRAVHLYAGVRTGYSDHGRAFAATNVT